MTIKDYKIGVIGYGGMGSWHCENISRRIAHLSVGGVYDISATMLAKAEKDGYKIFDSAEKLLNSDIDIVLIATPNNFHKDYAIMSMRSGKHVISEKPVCLNMVELSEILDVMHATGKKFTVHHNRRFDIDYAIVKEVLDKSIIGKPYFVESRLIGSKGLPGDWRSSAVAGGGMLYDWSVHLIDQILTLIPSEPVSVYAELLRVKFPEVDDCNKLHIIFANGVHADIVVDTWCYLAENRWQISGDDGTCIIPEWFGSTGKIIKANIQKIDWEEGCVYTHNGRSRTMSPRPIEQLENIELPVVGEPRWEQFYENFLQAIEGKAELIVSEKQIIANTKIVDACMLSAKENRVVLL